MSAVTRRGFVKAIAAAGGGLALGVHLVGCGSRERWPETHTGSLQPSAFLEITPRGEVIFQFHKSEMGQGNASGMATLIAEELGVDPASMSLRHAPVLDAFGSMSTGGSNFMRSSYASLRQVGAVAREMLLGAAALRLQQPASALHIVEGRIVVDGNDSGLGIGDLASDAAKQPVPKASAVALRSPQDFRYIGKTGSRIDVLEKVTGRADYSADQALEGFASAAVARCPHFGGSLRSMDDSAAKAMPGVHRVLNVDGCAVVVADTYWQARTALQQVKLEWDKGPLAGFDDDALREMQRSTLDADDGRTVEDRGKIPRDGVDWLDAEYRAPFMAHAAMEPLCCAVNISEQRVDVYSGTQVADVALPAVAKAIGRDTADVHVHNNWLGGAFGRRIAVGYMVEAARIAQAAGEPVKVQWSREDDMRGDNYRPAAMTRFRGALRQGKVVGIDAAMTAPSIIASIIPDMAAGYAPGWTPQFIYRWTAAMIDSRDPSSTEGVAKGDYAFDALRVSYTPLDIGVPVGFWRSVGHSQNAFFIEGFVDELAHATGTDPVEFRRQQLPPDSPLRPLLDQVAQASNWGNPPPGRFQGVAVHSSFGSKVAEVAEVSVSGNQIRVHKVWCAIDCGLAVNPDIVKAQMESGVVWGLSAALKGRITLADGAVAQSNFHDFEVLRMHECPEVEVYIKPSNEAPTGVGEPGVPPLAPAVANAVFAATGQRLRELPLRLT